MTRTTVTGRGSHQRNGTVNVVQQRAQRFLVELVYRHTPGDWKAATEIVDELLGDPESYLTATGLPRAARHAIMAQLSEPN
jgi:hypothetical protein